MKGITYGIGDKNDLIEIANLHALNWDKFYRGIMTDEYLDNEVYDERLNVWTKRFKNDNPKMAIITAKSGNTLVGFACHFIDYDPIHGHYLDNLHVHPDYRGKGIGKVLLEKSIQHCQEFGTHKYYLWVFDKNDQAIEFYKKMNGREVLRKTVNTPDGNSAPVLLYAWDI